MQLSEKISSNVLEVAEDQNQSHKMINDSEAVALTLSWPAIPTDMQHSAENVFFKSIILVTPIKLYTKMFLIS